MKSFDRIESHLPEHLADLAGARVPDYFDDLLQATARKRQRPAWSSLERWLPVDLTLVPVSNRARPVAGLAVLLLVGLLVAAGLLAYVGSHQPRIPAPFGPAGNGLMYYTSSSGDVYAADPTGGSPRMILAAADLGDGRTDGVVPERDGRRIVVGRTTPAGERLYIADADGSNLRPLPGVYPDQSEIDWSPDDRELAIVSTVNGRSAISVLPVDGSGARTLDLGLRGEGIWYLPDGRLVFRGTNGAAPVGLTYGFYVTDVGGANPRAILPPSTVESDWWGMSPSPDGRSLVYHVWREPYEKGRLRVVDIASGADRPLTIDGTTPADEYEMPQFSPDGSQVMFTWFTETGSRIAVVPAAGGRAVPLGPVGGAFEATPRGFFSPDGKTITAYYPATKELWLLDATGQGKDRKLSLPVSDLTTWQRVAAP